MLDFFQGFHVKLAVYVKNNIKIFLTNPQWFYMRKVARFNIARKWKNSFLQQCDYLSIGQNKDSFFSNANIDNIVDILKKDGLFQGIKLPNSLVKEILEFSCNNKCYAARNPKLGFSLHDKENAEIRYKTKIVVGKYFNTGLLCPAIEKLQNDPVLLEIAARYLKTKPVHISNSLFWSFPTNSTFFEQSKAAQVFHCDLDDYKFIKFFFYLTDVDLNGGPHVYILGSHQKRKILFELLGGRATEQNLINYYGSENIVAICGKAGWGFAEDTLGYHKGSPPIDKPRLLLQVQFATYDYGMQHDLVDVMHLKFI
jgi:hypothetical protein